MRHNMVDINTKTARATPRPEETRRQLFEKQKAMLDLFLEKGAISQQQYNKSLHDFSEKMGFPETVET